MPLSSQLANAVGMDPKKISYKPLSGGLTNQNYRVDANGDSFVVRLTDRSSRHLGIDRNREYLCSKRAAITGVGAEVIGYKPSTQTLITRFIKGKPISNEEVGKPRMLQRIIKSLKRAHKGPAFPGNFSPFKTVQSYHKLALRNSVKFPPKMHGHLDQMKQLERALKPLKRVPCHNDLLAANFIDDGRLIRIIDWEYAEQGDLFFDLANLSSNSVFGPAQDRLLLKNYFGRVRPADVARLELMKAASWMREAMWGYLQSGISKLNEDFLGYAKIPLGHFENQITHPQFKSWLKILIRGFSI